MCRSAHTTEVYSCLLCNKTFRAWRNFKRHNKEKHGGVKFSCSKCNFQTNRKETLERHTQAKHGSFVIVAEILDEVLSNCVQDSTIIASMIVDTILEDVMEKASQEVVEEDISPYLRARNERVAQIQVEFDKRFPTYWKEMKDLRMGLKVTKQRKKTVTFVTPRRRSSRIGDSFPGAAEETETAGTLEAASEMPDGADECGGSGDTVAQDEKDIVVTEMDMSVTEADVTGLGRVACLPCRKKFRYYFTFIHIL